MFFRVRTRIAFKRLHFYLYLSFDFKNESLLVKKITIKEIAEKAHVSPGTVDRVLHNRGEVSQKTREKILKIIRDGNYEPNIFARNLVLNKTYSVAALLPQHEEGDYWASQTKGIQQSDQELKAFGIHTSFYYFNESDASSFEKEALKLFAANPDAVLLAPVIFHKATWFAQRCTEKSIPYVIIDSDIPSVQKLSFIGQNAFQSGHLAAKLLDYGGENKTLHLVTITKLSDNNDIINQRKEGFMAYFTKTKREVNIKVSELHAEDLQFELLIKGFVDTVQPGDKIFVPNSKVHNIASGLKKQNKDTAVSLVGYDLIPKNVEYLHDNTIDFLINQKPEFQGYQGLQLLYKHLVLKQEVPETVFMPLEIVTEENVHYVNY